MASVTFYEIINLDDFVEGTLYPRDLSVIINFSLLWQTRRNPA